MDQFSQLFAPAVLTAILAGGIRLATPYLFAAIGETFGQLSGVLNLGVEGIMLIAGFAAFYAVVITGSLWIGLLVAAGVGLLMGLATAFITVTLKAQQGISGIGIYLFGLGFSDLLFHVLLGNRVQNVRGFPPVHIPLLSDIPVIGQIFFSHNVLTYIAFALVPIAWVIINRTTLGMQIRAVGHNPAAVDSLGLSVTRIRYLTVSIGGAMAGIAGASLSIALLNIFQSNLTNGLGFIAVALVYFGGWRPFGVLWGSLLFSTVNALQLWIQPLSIPIPPYLAVALPYILTILALVIATQRTVQVPAALTRPFTRGA
jgi:general nucleoside transport system permease protein